MGSAAYASLEAPTHSPSVALALTSPRGCTLPKPSADVALTYAALKERHRRLRDKWPEAVSLRIHRALSWYGRAEAEADDDDVRFILLWIGFNAAYSGHLGNDIDSPEQFAFQSYFRSLVELDRAHRIHDSLWNRFSQEVRLLLDNRFVFRRFWDFHNGDKAAQDWEAELARARKSAGEALLRSDTARVLAILFDRLYVLRNQVVHGGATWNGRANRAQLRDGAKILGWLLPVFVDLMMDHPGHNWGPPRYPMVEDNAAPATRGTPRR